MHINTKDNNSSTNFACTFYFKNLQNPCVFDQYLPVSITATPLSVPEECIQAPSFSELDPQPMSAKQVHVSAAPYPPASNLKPRLTECLSALHCLPYFIQVGIS